MSRAPLRCSPCIKGNELRVPQRLCSDLEITSGPHGAPEPHARAAWVLSGLPMISAFGPCRRPALVKDCHFERRAGQDCQSSAQLPARPRRGTSPFLARDVAISKASRRCVSNVACPVRAYLQTQADHSAYASHEERLGRMVEDAVVRARVRDHAMAFLARAPRRCRDEEAAELSGGMASHVR